MLMAEIEESAQAQIDQLKRELEAERHENASLRRLLFAQYAKEPRVLQPMTLPISERAVVLFEVLPERFTLNETLVTADRLGLTEVEAGEHIRTFFEEGMLAEDDTHGWFRKTGYRPYLNDE